MRHSLPPCTYCPLGYWLRNCCRLGLSESQVHLSCDINTLAKCASLCSGACMPVQFPELQYLIITLSGVLIVTLFIMLAHLQRMCPKKLIRILVDRTHTPHYATTTLLLGITDDAKFPSHFPKILGPARDIS